MAHCRATWRMQCDEHESKLFLYSAVRMAYYIELLKHNCIAYRTAIFSRAVTVSDRKTTKLRSYLGSQLTFYNIGDLEVQDSLARIRCRTNRIFFHS